MKYQRMDVERKPWPGAWYRWHVNFETGDLWRGTIRAELVEQQPPRALDEPLPAIHKRAVRWWLR